MIAGAALCGPRRTHPRDPGRATSSASCPCSTAAADRLVIAEGPTTLPGARHPDFEAVVTEQPAVAQVVLRGLAGRLRGLTEADQH